MKKMLIGLLSVGLLVACGQETVSDEEKKETKESVQADVEKDVAPTPDYDESTTFLTKEEQKEGFEYQEGLGGIKPYGFGYNDEVGIDGTDGDLKPVVIGPAKLTIENVRIVDIIPEAGLESMFEIDEQNERVRSVVMDVISENMSDKDISFYPDQMILTTDSGEQIESDMMLSDDVGGDFLGKVKKEGSVRFLLKKNDQEIKKVTFVIDAPTDAETFDSLGEQVRLEFDILSPEDALKKDKK